MSFWLFKSEPEKWSWDDQLRNFQASNNMKSIKIDDIGFFIISLKKRKLLE